MPSASEKYNNPYKYKKPRAIKALPTNRVQGATEDEILGGVVQGLPASDLEERWAKALDKLGDAIQYYEFRVPEIAGRNMPGEIEVDFLVHLPFLQPIQIDGGFSHKSAEQRAEDEYKDAVLNDHLRGMARPVIRVKDFELQSQYGADQKAREIFTGG